MAEFLVDQVVKGSLDSTGCPILTVYAKVSGRYAVYTTDERTAVQWADSATLSEDGKPLGIKQREAMASLAPLRSEINGLIDGWRSRPHMMQVWRAWDMSRAKRYDRLVAAALEIALAGDAPHALARLTTIRDELLAERISLGRVQYVVAALGIGLPAILLSFWAGRHFAELQGAATCFKGPDGVPFCQNWSNAVTQRWTAAAFGVLGAFLSVALQIRDRQVRSNLLTSDNVMDAALRISVGALSAVGLIALLQSHLFTLELAGSPVNARTASISMEVLIVASLAAGFTERLVSSVIGNIGPGSAARGAATAPAAPPPSPARGTETEPGGAPPPPLSPAADAAGGSSSPPLGDDDDEEDTDGCLEGHDDSAEPATDDSELPEAVGGVEGR